MKECKNARMQLFLARWRLFLLRRFLPAMVGF
jgi:hypothetical protein